MGRASAPQRARRTWRRPAVGVVLLLGLAVACSGGGGDEEAAGAEGEQAAAAETSTEEVTSSTHPEAEALEIVDPPEQPGVEQLHFEYGPIEITPGQNNIDFSGGDVPKPEVDGYITAIKANLVRPDGSVPPVDVIHLHHGVWANLSGTEEERRNSGGLAELFFAAGEEKTDMILPAGYGYPYEANDRWLINYMLHNLLSTPDEVSITYDIWFIPADAPEAADITVARPLWMDVQKGEIYPVFDALKGEGTDGVYTYPDDAGPDVYGDGPRLNEWVVDRDSVLLATAGHLHPGGLYTSMDLARGQERRQLFQSDAVYYEPAGAVSWDVAMTATPEDYRVQLRQGDVLSTSATYDTERASWYESMGIMIAWLTDGTEDAGGLPVADPFAEEVDPQRSVLTHGHLPENDNHGGEETDEFVNAVDMPDGEAADRVTIADFTYAPGDIGGIYDTVPTVRQGEALEFTNVDGPTEPNGIWHTITACEAPCTGATGVAYPLADAEVQFDSGQLGIAGVPTAGRLEWTIPENLEPGTYTYFCRVHPDMRGAFRVTP